MLEPDPQHPGWVFGWGVIRTGQHRDFKGIFETRDEAEKAAADAGAGYEARWVSHHLGTKDFVSGDEP